MFFWLFLTIKEAFSFNFLKTAWNWDNKKLKFIQLINYANLILGIKGDSLRVKFMRSKRFT